MFDPKKILIAASLVIAVFAMGSCRTSDRPAAAKSEPVAAKPGVTAFKEARLIVEINATDGDAGLQLFLDHEPWRTVALFHPDGGKIMEVVNQGALEDYGLTELFSESSEPSFKKFPLSEFKKLFPAGSYRLTGTTIDGKEIESTIVLSHDFPEGPEITAPAEDSRVPAAGLVVKWKPVTKPAGIKIIGYQVLVVREEPTVRTFSIELPPSGTEVTVPAEFLEAGTEYKVEVLAIEEHLNQTLSEVAFNVV